MRRQYYQRRYIEEPAMEREVRRQTPQSDGQIQARLEADSIRKRRQQNRRVRPKSNRIPTMLTGNESLG